MAQSHSKLFKGLLGIGLLLASIAALTVLQTGPRFEQPALNYAVMLALVVSVPLSLFWLAFAALSGGWRWVVVLIAEIVAFLVIFPAILICLDLGSIITSGVDSSFEPVAELREKDAFYRLYRTNGGATTAFGIALRKERLMVPGLKFVTEIEYFYPADDARFERLSSGQVRIRIEGGRTKVFEFMP